MISSGRPVGGTEGRREQPRPPLSSSLRGKGWLFTALLAVYFIIVSAVIAYERETMLESVTLLQSINAREESLVGLNYAVSRAVISVNENYFAPDVDASGKMLALEVEALLPGLTRLQTVYPELGDSRQALERTVLELVTDPSRATIADLRASMHRLVLDLDRVTSDVVAQKAKFAEQYHNAFQRLTYEWLAFIALALVLVALVFKVFFRGLSVDIDRVRRHASRVLRGESSPKLIHNRRDELGLLMDAVNRMQDELARRDINIELSRQQSFHKEKMAAVGSLAAAVAHEINNPLSAIVGVAQAIDQECQSSACAAYEKQCYPKMILEQATRVMSITRQISEFSVPQSQEPELTDLNSLLRSTANFVKFDRRFRLIDLSLHLDGNLPAVVLVTDHMVQVAMNLLINAADALGQLEGRSPAIRVTSSVDNDYVKVTIVDNGTGIPEEILPRVFEERFTTKGAGRGSGLGLSVCRSLVEKAGGKISISSEFGVGTEVTVLFPVPILGADCR
ncbi:MAG: histidine kinase [Proteobacteria bacterium]|nr:histidine kinase [Pseudomonadota bacterium]